jgi:3-hydroxyacyl-[acyl-carrier-protein] dehydratase
MTESCVLDTEEVMKRLPHRHPFLLVDRVLSVEAGKSITAVKNVTFSESHFSGHFPGHPVMPGVLVIEALAQAGGVLAWETANGEDPAVHILYLVGIEKARFKRTVQPGDQLLLKVDLVSRKRGLWRLECRAEVDGKLAAHAELLLATGKTS